MCSLSSSFRLSDEYSFQENIFKDVSANGFLQTGLQLVTPDLFPLKIHVSYVSTSTLQLFFENMWTLRTSNFIQTSFCFNLLEL